MPHIDFMGYSYHLDPGENLLDGLLRHGIKIPFSCRAGVCHCCMLQLKKGSPPPLSQHHLSPEQISKGYILACQSAVSGALTLAGIRRNETTAILAARQPLSATSLRLTLIPRFPINPGTDSRITLTAEKLTGLFPVERLSDGGDELYIIVERKAGDALSAWLHDQASPGDILTVRINAPNQSGQPEKY